MTADQVIALVSSVGTCAAAVGTFWTIWQIKKQQEASFHPEFALSRIFFEGKGSSKKQTPDNWYSRDAHGEIKPSNSRSFEIPLFNVGLGSGNDVMVTWSFSISDLVKQISEVAQQTTSPLQVTFERDVLNIKSDGTIDAVVFTKNDLSTWISYILPASVHKEGTTLDLPISYVYLVSLLIFLMAKDKEKTSFPEIPKLTIQFDYSDLGKNKRITKFDLIFNLVAFGGDGEFFNAYFQPQKVT